MKNLIITLLFTFFVMGGLHAQLCDTGRRSLDDLTTNEKNTLNTLIKQFLAEGAPANPSIVQDFPVIFEHMRPSNFPNIHSNPNNIGADFLDWHRYYIGKLEVWLYENGGAEFVPLPAWDPEDVVPTAFAGNSSLVDPNVNWTNPNNITQTLSVWHSNSNTNVASSVDLSDVMVDAAADCSNWTSEDNFANAVEFGSADNNHNGVHNAIQGVMSSHFSPSSTIFWTWHAYVDDLWACYQSNCVTGSRDVMVRDCVGDDGTEPSPDPPCTDLWKSPDIWVRNSNDGFVNQQSQQLQQSSNDNTAFVYVRIWNVGDLPIIPGDATVDLYWANASTGLSWPNPWNGTLLNCAGDMVPQGGTIASNVEITRVSEPYQQSNVIPAVDTDPYIILEVEWTIPDPDHYTNCFTNQWEVEHFCVLAIIDDGNTVNPSPFYSGLRNYNNMALKNISIVGDGLQMIVVDDPPHVDCALFANHTRRSMEDITLTLEVEGRNNIFEVADVYIELERREQALWERAGGKGTNFIRQRDGTLRLTGDGARLEGIRLEANYISNFCLTIVPRIATREVFEFDIVQRNGREVLGGETYVIQGIAERAQKRDQQAGLSDKALQSYVYPNPANQFIYYELFDGQELSRYSLYDIHGKLILNRNGQDQYGRIPVADQSRGTYLLKMVYKDGSFETHKVVLE